MPLGSWAAGWLTGDTVSVGEFKKGMGAIYDSTLSGSAASFDVSGIVASYAHLRLVMQLRSDNASTTQSVGFKFNNDGAANYDYQSQVIRTTNANNSAAAAGAIFIQSGTTGTSDTTGSAAALTVDIPNYAGTTFRKQLVATGWVKDATDGSTTLLQSIIGGGEWRSTAAINRITILPAAGNFIAGSRLTIYGIGA